MTAEAFLDEDTLDAEAFLNEAPPASPVTAESFLDTPEPAPAERPTGSLLLTPQPATPDRFAASSDNTTPQPTQPIDLGKEQADAIATEAEATARTDQGIKEGIFPPGSNPWKTIDGRLYIDPARYNLAVDQMWRFGVIDSDSYTSLLRGTVDQYDEATDSYIPSVEKATAARRDLERRAGSFPEAKAAASGLLKGAMQVGAAVVAAPATAAATIPTGPGAVVAGIAGGTAAALGTGAAYDALLEASAKESDLLDSFYAANQLQPGYNSAGQLVSILAPTPVSVTRLANAANLIRTEKGGTEAAKFITGALGAGAAIGVGTDVAIQSANLGLDKLLHPEISPLLAAEQYRQTGQQPPQRPEFSPASTALSATLGALTAGIGVKARNRVYFKEELPVLEQKVKLGTASREESADYFSMRRTVEILREDQRLLEAGAIAKSTVDFMGNRVLDTNTVINPRFQREILTQAGFEPQAPIVPAARPAIPYAAENPATPAVLPSSPAAYTGQTFINRGGPAPAFQGGSNALPGPDGVPALPGPAPAPSNIIPFDPSTATPVDDISPTDGLSLQPRNISEERRKELRAAVIAAEAEPQKQIDPHPGLTFNEIINQRLPLFAPRAKGRVKNLPEGYVKQGDLYVYQPSTFIPPNASTATAAASGAPEPTGSPDLATGQGASVSTPPPPFAASFASAPNREAAGTMAREMAMRDPSLPPPPPSEYDLLQAIENRNSRRGYDPSVITPENIKAAIDAGYLTKTKIPKFTDAGRAKLSEWKDMAKERDTALFDLQDQMADQAVSEWDAANDPTSASAIAAKSKSRSSSKSFADAGPPTPVIPAVAPIPKPPLETYNDAQVFADYPDAVGVSRADNGVWTMPVILGGMDKVPAIELPEGIEFFRTLSGNNPQIRVPRKRNALGTFLPAGKGYITLRPDLIAAGGESAANMIFMHEAGHFIQFMDDFKMKKGNLLGIIAGVRSTKESMPLDPNAVPAEGWGFSEQPITAKQREAIRRRAEEDLRASLEGEVRRVLVEEPVYAQSGVTPEIVKSLFGLTAREQWPELYDWFAKQDGATKKAIVKQAMKGLVDSRLAKFQIQGEQIGTNTREEVQNIGGREPTPDELREAFHAAMRAEMSARNVADFKYIRQELIDLTRWWKPFDISTAPDDYIKYRLSAEELFADAMSVLLNSPADLKARAPIFYETFWNHLDTRPQVKAKLIDIYDRINKGRDNVLSARQERDWQNYAKGDKAFLDAFEKATSRRTSLTGLWDDLRDQYWDQFFPLTSAINKARTEGKLPRAEDDPYRYLTEEHPMADSLLQQLLSDLQRVRIALDNAGIGPFYLDDYLRYTRIAFEKYEVKEMVDGEMKTIGYEQSPTLFNPGGETKRTAQDRLDYMRANLPPEKWAILESSAKAFRDLFHQNVKNYWEKGMLTDDLWQKFDTNDNYATFTVLDYVKEFTPSRIVARKGTTAPIYRPSVEMAKKMVSMFRAAQHNHFKSVMASRLMQISPDIATRAPMKFNGKFMEPQKPTDSGWRLITWREKGQLVGAHIQERWADAIDQHSPAMGDAILKSLNWGFRNTVYNLIIRYNPNFQLFTGPIKDLTRSIVNQPGGARGRLALIGAITRDVIDLSKSRDGRRVIMEFTGTSLAGIAGATAGATVGAVGGGPGMALGGVIGGNAASYAGFFAGRLFAHAIESLPWLPDDPTASVDWARGDIGRSALMREMIENFAIGGPWAYLGRGLTTTNTDEALDAIVGKFHVGGEPRPLPWILRQIANYFNDVEFAGQILQVIPKTSSYRVNTRDLGMARRDAAYWVRNHIGLPNTFKKGKHIGGFQAVAPFANIFLRAFESMGKLISGREKIPMGGGRVMPNKKAWAMSWQQYVFWFFLAGGGVAAIMQRLGKEGVLGEDIAKSYAGSSEYDISNKGVLPLGTVNSPTGTKSALLTIPIDENNRLLFATISKITKVMVRMAQGRPLDVQGFDILSGFTATLPGQNPVVEVGDKWGQFFTGKSPVNHRNQPILSEDEQKAGGLYAVKPMIGWTLNETGVSNFFRYDPRASTFTEAALGSVPAFNRFLKITDQGSRESMRNAEAGEQKFRAIKRLEMPAPVIALRKEYYWLRSRGEARTPQEELRYQELQGFETFFQNRLEEADTANTLGRQSEVDFAIRSIIQESKLYRAR